MYNVNLVIPVAAYYELASNKVLPKAGSYLQIAMRAEGAQHQRMYGVQKPPLCKVIPL